MTAEINEFSVFGEMLRAIGQWGIIINNITYNFLHYRLRIQWRI